MGLAAGKRCAAGYGGPRTDARAASDRAHRAAGGAAQVTKPAGAHQLARRRPHPVEVDRTPLCASLRELGALTFCQVRRAPQEGLFNWLIESEHYLGYTRAVGEHLKFMVYARRGWRGFDTEATGRYANFQRCGVRSCPFARLSGPVTAAFGGTASAGASHRRLTCGAREGVDCDHCPA